jgi:membrane dipeptidase
MQSVFDGHNDALTCSDHNRLLTGRLEGDLDLPRMRAGGLRGAIFAVFTEGSNSRKRVVQRGDAVLEFAYDSPVDHAIAAADAAAVAGRLLRFEREGGLRLARRIGDIDQARDDDGPPAAVLHLEGAEAIDAGLESLDFWYQAGLRSLGPVWSRANAFGWGVPFISPSSPDIGPGLTAAGRGLVTRCAELGILVDVSHLNEAGFWDLARLELGPVVASHAGVHAVAAASRNLTDAQLDEIGASGGLVGIVFAAPFLRDDFADDSDTPIELIARHARYVAERIGVEHVALGSDFDGATIPKAIDGADGLPRVLDALRHAGFTAREIDAIAWTNWRRVLAAWWRD